MDPASRLLAGLDPQAAARSPGAPRALRPPGARRRPREGARSLRRSTVGAAPGFPYAAKLRAVAARRGRPVIVVNAAEGEPLSHKDKLLIGRLPHLVIDGAVALAAAIGAREVLIAHAESARHEARRSDGSARGAAAAPRPHLGGALLRCPDGYVTGQETALINFLNGGPALPDLHAAPAVRIGRRRSSRRWFRTPRPRHRSPSSRATAAVGSAESEQPPTPARLSSACPVRSLGPASTRQPSESL